MPGLWLNGKVIMPNKTKLRDGGGGYLKHLRYRGVVIVWAVLLLFLLILIVGLSVDTAKVVLTAHQLQNAADAAALAGGRLIKNGTVDDYHTEAREKAIQIALANFADRVPVALDWNLDNLAGGDIVTGRYYRSTRTFEVRPDRVNALKVVARRTETAHEPVPLIFGPIVKVVHANVSRDAIAMSTGNTGAGVIVLSPDDCQALTLDGSSGDITVNGGSIQVNSLCSNYTCNKGAVVVNGSPTVEADELNLSNPFDSTCGDIENDLPVNTDMDAIPDPYAGMPDPPIVLPDLTTPANSKITGGAHTLWPGYYSGGFTITGGDVTFKPGIYVVDGTGTKGGLQIGGNANATALGVMFFVKGGPVNIDGTGSIQIEQLYPPNLPPKVYSDGPEYNGMAIFQDRENLSPAKIRGTSTTNIDGTIYFPENHLSLGGTGDGIGVQVLAHTMEILGNTNLTVNYDGRNEEEANHSFLVE
jgi:hypothetical protein